MASTFPFLPRTLVKGKQKDFRNASHTSTSTVPSLPPMTTTTPGPTKKAKYSDEEYINLFNLALSDYALWADPDLRRCVDCSSTPLSNEHSENGFFPLSHLIRRSKVLSPLNIEDLQIQIAKALRSDATSALEVRLLVSEPSSSVWSGKRETRRDIGAYEVRQRNRGNTSTRPSQSYSRQDWEDRTIYVENIPIQFKTIPAIVHVINSLLSERSLSEPRSTRVQGIILPPHHQDKPGDAPTYKGFALIVLEDILDVDFLLKRWPWDRRQNVDTDLENLGGAPAEVNEAIKFGFRALSKSRWLQLKEEYLSYRQSLVAEINAFQDATERPMPTGPVSRPNSEPVDANDGVLVPTEPLKLVNTSPYPFNSLVFVRNVHPETNKTTLRKFFGRVLGLSLASNEMNSDGIDYVDYNKGMDTCHLRLATPKHARILVDHFLSHLTIHSAGLDDIGKLSESEGTSPPVLMELVTGKREQLYWEKVPEKVRIQAVQKVLASVQGVVSSSVETGDGNRGDGAIDTKKRKRQKC